MVESCPKQKRMKMYYRYLILVIVMIVILMELVAVIKSSVIKVIKFTIVYPNCNVYTIFFQFEIFKFESNITNKVQAYFLVIFMLIFKMQP